MIDRGPGSTRLDPDEFTRLADGLFTLAEAGGRLAAARVEATDRALRAAQFPAGLWTGPHAQAFNEGVSVLGNQVRDVGPALDTAFQAVGGLAGEARHVGAVLREADQYEKSWNQQLVANVSEWQDRATTAAAAMVPWADEAKRRASEELTRAYQEQTRRTEEASERRRVALQRWHEQCGHTVDRLRQAAETLDGRLRSPIPQFEPVEYHPDAVRAAIQLAWARLVDRAVARKAGDPTQLAAWWNRLDAAERKVVMQRRPDLIAGPLWDVLSELERKRFASLDNFVRREVMRRFKLEGAGNVGPVAVRVMVEGTATQVVASDGSAKGSIELRVEAGAGAGIGKSVIAELAQLNRLVVNAAFASEAELASAVAELEAALRSDLADDPRLGRTWRVLSERFGLDRAKVAVAHGIGPRIAGGAGGGAAGAAAEGKLFAGAYVDTDRNEVGTFLEATFEAYADSATIGQATFSAKLDGQLARSLDGREYLRFATTADVAVSRSLLLSLGLSEGSVGDLDLPSGGGTFKIEGAVEITDANTPTVMRFLTDLAGGRINPDTARAVHEAGEISVVTATGTHVIMRLPQNPYVGGEVAAKDSETVTAWRKTPESDYYRQGGR